MTTTPTPTPTTHIHDKYLVDLVVDFSPSDVIGDLRVNEKLVGDPRVTCRQFCHMVPCDTLCALGFKSGGRRRVRAAKVIEGVGYVLVEEGWYRWSDEYVYVV